MATAKLYNGARMTTTTTGTGTITLGSAVSGFLTFAQAGIADGDTVSYSIKDGVQLEVGRGVYTSSGTTLTRSVLKSTNSNSAITLSGAAEVMITALAEDFIRGEPIVILASGQSNMSNDLTYSWTPPANLYYWNWNGSTGNVGTAFAAPSGSTIGTAKAFGAKIARNNPDREVYVVNISIASQAISHWLTGTGSPDIYNDIQDNVTPALAAIGVSKIDALLWWQGEDDAASPGSYVANFETFVDRLKAETWFQDSTPIVVYGLNSSSNGASSNYDNFTSFQQATVAADPDNRAFVYTATIPSSFWNADTIHMLASGYDLAGILGANSFVGRGSRAAIPNLVIGSGGNISIGAQNTPAVLTLNANSDKTVPALDSGLGHVGPFYLIGTGSSGSQAVFRNAGSTTGCGIQSAASRGTLDSPSAVQSSDNLFSITARGYGATGFPSLAAGSMEITATENWTDSACGCEIRFATIPNGSASITAAARITGSRCLKIGGSANRGTTEGTNQLVLFNGTAPAGTLTNGVSFYSASGEARVMDAAGNSTLLSPHDQETNEWIYHSVDTRTGKGLRIDMERMMRAINDKFGWDFVKEFEAKD
jgi:hypothetical protein